MQLARRKQLRHRDRKDPSELDQFGIRNPADSAFDSGDDSPRNVPTSALTRGGKVRLRPPLLHPNSDDLRADNIASGFHEGRQP